MFSGIVENVGTVAKIHEGEALRRIHIDVSAGFLDDLQLGASVAVDGACLTLVEISADGFVVEVIGTTLSRTVAGDYRPGSRVNLERAMLMGGRLDGHLVQGHIDGIGEIMQILDEGEFRILRVGIPDDVHRLTLVHGSIALNGVSLTVNGMGEDGTVDSALIPHTREATNLGALGPGDRVNVEGDLIGKYVGKLLRDQTKFGER